MCLPVLLQRRLPGLQDYKGRERVVLAPGHSYRLRVTGVNAMGPGDFSPVVVFRTCLPGFPGAPSAVKITKVRLTAHGSRLSAHGSRLTDQPPI